VSALFDNNLAYPSDHHGGRFVEFEGEVVKVLRSAVEVKVEGHGIMTGYSDLLERRPDIAPRPGDTARIRCYDGGGGFYPDDRIMGWSQKVECP